MNTSDGLSKPSQKPVTQIKRDHRRTLAKFVTALGAIVFALLVDSSPFSYAAFPGINGKITFQSNRDGNDEIYVMNADGSGQTNLSNNPADDQDPAWSSDGSQIAFHSTRDSNLEIYVMNADGSGQTNLTNNPAFDPHPTWSPDGSQIAFQSFRDGNQEIYVMNIDGSGQTNLSNNLALDDHPAWSPDGSQIAFRSLRDGNGEIYVMNVDGSGQTRLTNNLAFEGFAAWSPDGLQIAFASNRDGNLEIYVMRADGSSQIRLTNDPSTDMFPDWQPLPISVILVEIDIKPGSDPNSINLKSKEVIPVAILTTEDFDATTVDPLSVEFGSNGATESHGQGHLEDVDSDGDQDLVLHFKTQETGIQCEDTTAELVGETFGGQAIAGPDLINIVKCN